MISIEIYWDDLTAEKQQEILSIAGDNLNWDVIPIYTIEILPGKLVKVNNLYPAVWEAAERDICGNRFKCR